MKWFHFWPITLNWNFIIDLDAHLIDKCVRQVLWCSKLFSPPLSQTFEKPNDGVSLLTNFSELKFDYRFICTATFATFLAILTPFKSNTCETAWRSFTFDQFLIIKFDHWFGCPFHRQACTSNSWRFEQISPHLSHTIAK